MTEVIPQNFLALSVSMKALDENVMILELIIQAGVYAGKKQISDVQLKAGKSRGFAKSYCRENLDAV